MAMNYELIKVLTKRSIRIFTTEEAQRRALDSGIHPHTIIDRLHDLKKGVWSNPL